MLYNMFWRNTFRERTFNLQFLNVDSEPLVHLPPVPFHLGPDFQILLQLQMGVYGALPSLPGRFKQLSSHQHVESAPLVVGPDCSEQQIELFGFPGSPKQVDPPEGNQPTPCPSDPFTQVVHPHNKSDHFIGGSDHQLDIPWIDQKHKPVGKIIHFPLGVRPEAIDLRKGLVHEPQHLVNIRPHFSP